MLPSLEDGGEAEEDEGIVLLSSECGGEVSCLIDFCLLYGKRSDAKTDILRYEECKTKADNDKNSD